MPDSSSISKKFVDTVCSSIREGRKVRRNLPSGGRIYIERQLPFLVIYRQPSHNSDWGTADLITGESSFLVASPRSSPAAGLAALVKAVAATQKDCFGAFVILEVWSGADVDSTGDQPVVHPGFRVIKNDSEASDRVAEKLAQQLSQIKISDLASSVEIVERKKIAPGRMEALLKKSDLKDTGLLYLGLEVSPIYRDHKSGNVFPLILENLQKQLTVALEKFFLRFMRKETTICPPNYMTLGRRSLVHAVWEVDRKLAEVASQIDFLLLVTPTNADHAYEKFAKSKFEREPLFLYRPAPFDPPLLKRQLYRIGVERIEDPTMAQLFRDQQDDIGSRISMVSDRGSRRFHYGSLQVYEKPDDKLVELAMQILKDIPDREPGKAEERHMGAREFAIKAEDELAKYRDHCPDLDAQVHVRKDLSGVMVSGGNLLVSRQQMIPVSRANALINHEIGTHIITHYNGSLQPFRQLSSGLPGYDELQESLAVLAEYLVGGLTGSRIRQLGARVMAVHWLAQDATFVEVFRKLTQEYSVGKHEAYLITMRVFRSGGFTKDVVYLRGLVRLLEQLKDGLELDILYIGKFGIDYLSIVKELIWRKILQPARIYPHFLERPTVKRKLARLKKGMSVLELAPGC